MDPSSWYLISPDVLTFGNIAQGIFTVGFIFTVLIGAVERGWIK
jgi:hypothetical protein